jgi:hypothetical protein
VPERKIFAITSPRIIDTGKVGWGFQIESNAEFGAFDALSDRYGYLKLAQERWSTNVFDVGKGFIYGASGDEDPGEITDAGLTVILERIPNCVLLMQRDLFDRFESACRSCGIDLGCHHAESPLATS